MRLGPALLAKEYGASTTVLREAMILLTGDRLVVSTPGSGFSIPELERSELKDLTLLRCHNESLALQLAIERGGLKWETEVISAHHIMTRIPRRTLENPEVPNPEWFNAHRTFHSKLLSGCGIPALIDICEKLSSATEIYRVYSVPMTRAAKRDVETEHADLLEAVLAHDTPRAVALLKAHYETTEAGLLANWPA
ncbi:DNA-binding transcriptional regulator CsiR [Paenochrobactrum glaciei]|uniref:DNA-binding transcriptional regulator CsiR n=2 Tax=Paenochrobactrum glaciei TaxID=486407 RepID=A0ABN1GQ37_9HYPH